jgi:ubiquinone/menaquinone biosynthesis C-methylase UbiE
MTSPPPTDEERKGQIAANFDGVADTYDGMSFVIPTATRLVELAALQAGESVLDVATGTGWAALAAAKAVGPTGHVVGTDIAAAALERARTKAAEAGLENIVFRVGDAEAPDLADATVNVVLCASGIFFLLHPDAAVREWRRVTSPGGRVLFSSFERGHLGPLQRLFREHFERFLASEPPPSDRVQAADCESLLRAAGLDEVRVTEQRLDYHVPTAEAWWNVLWSGPARLRLLRLTSEQMAALRAAYLADVERLATPAGIPVEVHAIFASGVVPGT